MRYNSITFKILLLVVLLLVLTSVTVIIVVDLRLKVIADNTQEKVYSEKIELILSRLNNYQKRLEQTGLEKVYRDDFQKLALERLWDNYYKADPQQITPVIFGNKGKILLSENYAIEDALPGAAEEFAVLVEKNKDTAGDIYFEFNAEQFWGIYRLYSDWEWNVGYILPLEVKYGQMTDLRNNLIYIMGTAVCCCLLLLVLFLSRIIRPIVYLTDVAGRIADGELEHNINVHTRDEVGRLAGAFDKMRLSIRLKLSELSSEVAERRQAENNLLVTLNSIGDAVITTNKTGLIVHMNPVAVNLTGWQLLEAVGRPLLDVFSIVVAETGMPCVNPVERVMASGKIISLEQDTMLISRNGNSYKVADSASPIRNDNGTLLGVVIVFRDVTEQYKLEERLRQADKMKAVGQLAGGIAHDFNNMLGGIIGAAEILSTHLDDSRQAKELHAIIVNAAERAAELTKQLLAFSRSRKIATESVNLHDIINESVALLKRTIDKSINIIIDMHADNYIIDGEPAQLQNVIINLSINASHAMPEGGILTISTKNIYLDNAFCRSSNFDLDEGEYVEFVVRDTGCGIPPESLSCIFDPFFTTKKDEKGTGLGLSAVYGTVLQHHGAIKVYSEVDKGTVFYMFFPVSMAESKPLPEMTVKTACGEGKILVIDDEPIMRVTAEAVLEDAGYDVILAENGKEGVEIYKERRDEIDLVILDMIMPIMNGKECFNLLKDFDNDVKVILASGFSKDEDVEKMTQKDLCAFISKPYRSSELTGVIAEVLAK